MLWVSKIRLKINQKKYLNTAITVVLDVVGYGEPDVSNVTVIGDIGIVEDSENVFQKHCGKEDISNLFA